jgi:7-cyano-7-deazaguanine reductase
MMKRSSDRGGYTEKHAKSGLSRKLPKIECWPNQFKDYQITIEIPEYTSKCPKTGNPDFGCISVQYIPDELCVELKSLKSYILGYRNLGIFYENAVNRILKDFVAACRPVWARVSGEFNPRGGISTIVEAEYGAPKT